MTHILSLRKHCRIKKTGLVSVVTLTELIKIHGKKDNERMHSDLNNLITSNLVFVDVNDTIAIRAGELRLKYDIPTIDSIIASTGIVNNVKHILTDDDHFKPLKNMIKPIDLDHYTPQLCCGWDKLWSMQPSVT